MTERTTYQQNMEFIEQTVKRLEQNEVGIDELETLATEFSQAVKFCGDRITRIEGVLQQTLQGDRAGS
ncbi:exodeoxyribonuclease VII small subunit [Pseudomonas sp. GOM6]|uniref:exodeoxyribonuclease VII small subunit n=1 Tax=Pseudomonas sp. GOM6 TaxID=3036944 RepID=UPI00240A974D|nr:exodeoxyribonuclease VII small subunit [Pseudomonas sp. GOM6]MDG1581024.1 exodeoxyribonuclease VII small subunit [Pseudomonas sp. GOM6]